MAQAFRNVVSTPELAAEKLRKMIQKTNPEKFVAGRRALKNEKGEKDVNAELKDDIAIGALNIAKWSAWLAAGGTQFMLTLARWMTLDNSILRQMEDKLKEVKVGVNKNGNKKLLHAFAKKYPNLSAHILWYFALSLVVGGGVVVSQSEKVADAADKAVETVDKAVDTVKDINIFNAKTVPETYSEFLKQAKLLTPLVIADLIAKEGVNLNKDGLHEVYLDGKNVPTIGYGSTVLKNGKKVTKNTPPITNEEAYELARWHLEDRETYFTLYCYLIGTGMAEFQNNNDFFGMTSIIYNAYSKMIEDKNDRYSQERFDALRNAYKQYGNDISSDVIKELFKKYPIQKPTSFGSVWLGQTAGNVSDKIGGFLAEGAGIVWRRWLEAGLMSGDITTDMLLQCPINGMYEFYVYMGRKKENFFIGTGDNKTVNKETFAVFKDWLKNPVNKKGQSLKHWKKVADYLPAEQLQYCYNFDHSKNTNVFEKLDFPVNPLAVKGSLVNTDEYKKAYAEYQKQNYDAALALYKTLEGIYPDSALIHNDLAGIYNKIGEYQNAISHARTVILKIGDKSQYGVAQYNAGIAYENIGDFDKALQNYKLAAKNGVEKAKNDVKRIENKGSRTIAYFDAADKIKMKDKNRVYAQNQAIQDFVAKTV